ncbi:hypothetical protein AGLY_005224, partial [Aphis glycines]
MTLQIVSIAFRSKTYGKLSVEFFNLKKTQNILKIKSCKENANLNNWYLQFSSIYDLYFLNNNKYLKSFGINRCRHAISFLANKKNVRKGKKGTLYKIFNIYDLYFLNNNKYLKSFGINRCRHAISYEHKKFYDFSTSKLLANFRVFDRFRKNLNYKRLYTKIEQLIRNLFFWSSKFFLPTLQKKICIKIENFSVFELQPYKKINSVENWFCVKIPVFPSFFFLFFSIFLKTVRKCLLFTFKLHQGYSLFHRKLPPKFEIEALFRLVMLFITKDETPDYCQRMKHPITNCQCQ